MSRKVQITATTQVCQLGVDRVRDPAAVEVEVRTTTGEVLDGLKFRLNTRTPSGSRGETVTILHREGDRYWIKGGKRFSEVMQGEVEGEIFLHHL